MEFGPDCKKFLVGLAWLMAAFRLAGGSVLVEEILCD